MLVVFHGFLLLFLGIMNGGRKIFQKTFVWWNFFTTFVVESVGYVSLRIKNEE